MPYLILDVDGKDANNNYETCIIGYPSREYCWIMARTPSIKDDVYNSLTKQLVEKHQYNLEGLRKVPQVWTHEERKKRGLTEKEIPDSYLKKTNSVDTDDEIET